MTQNINTAPWYDDFDEFKNYHQILFRPGYSVQARELTQIQSILKNQIAKFGNHIFRQGSIVIPGNSFTEMAVPCVKVENAYLGVTLNLTLFEGKVIVGESSGVRAHVKKVVPAEGSDPITFYLSYLSGGVIGGVPNGKSVFDAGENLQLEVQTSVKAVVKSSSHLATGTMAYVNSGVYYVNGTFVSNTRQSVVMSKYDVEPSCHVLFKITESVVDYAADETLLDPAQGSYNFAAPGADRLKLQLDLVTLPLDGTVTEDYVELMRYDTGVLQEHANAPKYNELEKALAQRTYDESGDYVVNGLTLKTREHKRDLINGGLYPAGDYGKFSYELQNGKAYFKGLAIENLAGKRVITDKARTPAHVLQSAKTIKPDWGQYLLVAAPQGSIDIMSRESVNLYNAATGGSIIGTAKVIGIDYFTGSGVGATIFKLYISNLTLNTGASYDQIGRAQNTGATFVAKVVNELNAPVNAGVFASNEIVNYGSAIRTGTVSYFDSVAGMLYVFKHDATKDTPKAGDSIIGATSTTQSVVKAKRTVFTGSKNGLVFPLPQTATKALKNSLNNFDLEYTGWVKLTIPTGSSTASIGSGRFVPKEAGTFVALNTVGVDTTSTFTFNGTGTSVTMSPNATSDTTIYCQVVYENAAPRTKSITTHSASYTAGQVITLTHADVYQIDSITNGTVDITSRYELNNGQTDYEYGLSSLKLKNGFTTPSGPVTVTYKYFLHSAGNFFTIDSYPNTIDNDLLPDYTSPADGKIYKLRDCVDFRKTVGTSSGVVVPETFLSTSTQVYLPRIDVVCIDRNGNVQVLNGTPALAPKAPQIPETLYALSAFVVPAYTYQLGDIKQQRLAVTRTTMEGVSDIVKRIDRLEAYSELTATEVAITNTPFLDAATGLDRFKTGYLVESMANPFQVADAFTDSFKASINNTRGISSLSEEDAIGLTLLDTGNGAVIDTTALGNTLLLEDSRYSTSTFFVTNGLITLPYYDKIFAKVDISSRISNVNPFNVVAWAGSIKMVPDSDLWVETVELPDVIVNIEQHVGGGVIHVPGTPAPQPQPWVPVVQGPIWQPQPVPPTERPIFVPVGPTPPEPQAPAPVPNPPEPPRIWNNYDGWWSPVDPVIVAAEQAAALANPDLFS